MSSFNPTMDAAIQQPFIRAFTAIQIILPDHNINLIDGSGFVSFGGMTFNGYDPTFGTVSEISTVSAAFVTQSPSFDITLMPPSVDGVVMLNNPLYQLAPVTLWIGIMNEATGQPFGTPYQLFLGGLDYAKSTIDTSSLTVQLHIVSAYDRMFIGDEAARLNQQFHQSIHPGETGFSLNNSALVEPYWGQVATTNPQFPTLPIAATLQDRLSGQTSGGSTTGTGYGIGGNFG